MGVVNTATCLAVWAFVVKAHPTAAASSSSASSAAAETTTVVVPVDVRHVEVGFGAAEMAEVEGWAWIVVEVGVEVEVAACPFSVLDCLLDGQVAVRTVVVAVAAAAAVSADAVAVAAGGRFCCSTAGGVVSVELACATVESLLLVGFVNRFR
jgi:hypothetical protein